MNVAYIRKTALLAVWLVSPPPSAQRQMCYPRKAKQGFLFVRPVWGRDVSMHCLMRLYQQLFAVQTCAVSLFPLALHLVTSVGYFCHIYMLQYYTKLLRTFFSEFYSVAAMPLWHILWEYITCPEQRLMLAKSSLPAKPEVCWPQLLFLTSSYNILVTYSCWNKWVFISNLD